MFNWDRNCFPFCKPFYCCECCCVLVPSHRIAFPHIRHNSCVCVCYISDIEHNTHFGDALVHAESSAVLVNLVAVKWRCNVGCGMRGFVDNFQLGKKRLWGAHTYIFIHAHIQPVKFSYIFAVAQIGSAFIWMLWMLSATHGFDGSGCKQRARTPFDEFSIFVSHHTHSVCVHSCASSGIVPVMSICYSLMHQLFGR